MMRKMDGLYSGKARNIHRSPRLQFTNKSVLVTGGTGFVGSHLVERLLQGGNYVTTTVQRSSPKSYFYNRKLDKKATTAYVDINDFDSVHDLVSKTTPDYIFHLAAQPLVGVAYHNPRQTLSSNILGTINILESARQLGYLKGIIVASSDKAYGKKQKEFSKYSEDDPLRGDHPYEVSKSSADLICYSYYKTYGLPVIVTRFGNIYGEGDLNFSRIIPGIMKSIICGETLEIRSDGTFVRDYLYIKDVVRAYIMLASAIKRGAGESFNFGSSDNYSVLDLVKIIEDKLKFDVKCKVLNIAKNEIPYQSLDFTKINKVLGWEPQYSVIDTVRNIEKWYRMYFK